MISYNPGDESGDSPCLVLLFGAVVMDGKMASKDLRVKRPPVTP